MSKRVRVPGLTVGVARADDRYSAVWRYWAVEEELYAAPIGGGRLFKLSLHSSGRWRLALHQPMDTPVGRFSDSRIIHRWGHPGEFTPGWTQAFDLLVPSVNVPERMDKRTYLKPSRQVTWIEAAPQGAFVLLTLLLGNPSVGESPPSLNDSHQVIGSVPLASGSVAWLVAQWAPMSDVQRAFYQSLVDDTVFNSPGQSSPVTASILRVQLTDDHPVLSDVALGHGNYRFADPTPASGPLGRPRVDLWIKQQPAE